MREAHRFDEARSPLDAGARRGLSPARSTVEQFKGGQSNPTYRLTTPAASATCCAASRRASCCPRRTRSIANTASSPRCASTDVPVAKTYAPVRGRQRDRHRLLRHGRTSRAASLGPSLPGMTPAQRARHLRRDEPRDRRAARVDYAAIGLGDYGKPGNYFARQIDRWTKQYRASETEKIEAMERLIEWLPQHMPAGDETTHRPRRLPPRQHDLPSDRAAHARGARLGAVDARPSAGRFLLSHDDMALGARRVSAASPGSISPALGIPERGRISRDLLPAHRPQPTSRTGISTWPTTCSGWRRSCRASWGASSTATPSSANAREQGARARLLAEAGWRMVEQGGAA